MCVAAFLSIKWLRPLSGADPHVGNALVRVFVQTGILIKISKMIYGEEKEDGEKLGELVEDVHIVLFAVMIL